MTKELAQTIINGYSTVIQEVMQMTDIVEILEKCEDTYTDAGICWYCTYALNEKNVHNDEWISSIIPSGRIFWAKPPFYTNTKEEVLNALQYRVNKLQEYIDNN